MGKFMKILLILYSEAQLNGMQGRTYGAELFANGSDIKYWVVPHMLRVSLSVWWKFWESVRSCVVFNEQKMYIRY